MARGSDDDDLCLRLSADTTTLHPPGSQSLHGSQSYPVGTRDHLHPCRIQDSVAGSAPHSVRFRATHTRLLVDAQVSLRNPFDVELIQASNPASFPGLGAQVTVSC
jgi:hypothetical protein